MKKGKYSLKKWIAIGLMVILVAGVMTGCGSSSYSAADDNRYSDGVQSDNSFKGTTNGLSYDSGETGDVSMEEVASDDYSDSDIAAEASASSAGGSSEQVKINKADNKKIIKTYNYSYETEEFDKVYAELKKLINKYDGYVASSNMTGTTYRSLSLTVKIPADKSDEFVENTGFLGTLRSQSENAEDVTLEYSDTESHISALRTEQKRLDELLGEADSLETILVLENRLSEVRYELESYQSRKNQLDSLITYSTVRISLDEVKYTVEVNEESFFSRIAAGLKTTFRDISSDFTDFAVWFIINLPYFIIWIIIIFIIVKIIKALIRRARKKKEKRLEKKAASEVNEDNKEN